MAVLPKTIYKYKPIPKKITMSFSTEIEKLFQKFIWKQKRSQIAK
jgi:hypothetical protein